MTSAPRMLTIIALLGFLIGIVGCNSSYDTTATPTCNSTVVGIDTPAATTSPSISKTSTPADPVIPSPTPWLDAFQRVTQTPVDHFWWDETEIRLYYRSNHYLWQYDPVLGRTTEVSSTTPIYGEPLSSVLARIPNDIPHYDVYFAPSGTKALFKVSRYEYAGDAPGPDTDGEIHPISITSELWYVDENELATRQLGTVDGMPTGVSWDQNENHVLVQMGDGMYPPTDSAGWFISLRTGDMWNLFPVTAGETITSYLRPQIAPDGNRVLFTQCIRKSNGNQCTHYIRTLKNSMYSDEIISPPVSGGFLILPNNRGLLIIDEITLYLYDWESKTTLQLSNDRPPYTWGSLPMDSPREVKLSRDLHYLAWNGPRGLQVFSLCPGGGVLLDCD
jgi:hypothetical protein